MSHGTDTPARHTLPTFATVTKGRAGKGKGKPDKGKGRGKTSAVKGKDKRASAKPSKDRRPTDAPPGNGNQQSTQQTSGASSSSSAPTALEPWHEAHAGFSLMKTASYRRWENAMHKEVHDCITVACESTGSTGIHGHPLAPRASRASTGLHGHPRASTCSTGFTGPHGHPRASTGVC